jgi:hypothetical protein
MLTSTDRQTFRETVALVAAMAKERLPQAINGRLEGAIKLVLAHDVTRLADGTIEVGSCTDPLKTYRLVGTACECKDFVDGKAPEGWCRHRIAAGIAKRVRELLPPAPESTPEVHPVCTSPLPEAPASCNVYVLIGGHKVQVTLRDSDEARMLARLHVVLAQYPAVPGPTQDRAPSAPAPTGGLPPCPYGHGFLRKSSKREGFYCPRKNEDGTFCKGRA